MAESLRLPASVLRDILEWVVGANQDDADADRERVDAHRPMTEPRRAILRFATVSREWYDAVQRVVLACIEPNAALVDLLDANPALWWRVQTVMLNWDRNPMLEHDDHDGTIGRCVAAVLRSARNAQVLGIEAYAHNLDRRFFDHCAPTWRVAVLCIWGDFDEEDDDEEDEYVQSERTRVSAMFRRLITILTPSLESLDVGLAWADTETESRSPEPWPLLPRLEALKVLLLRGG